jgi:hypothetical protein
MLPAIICTVAAFVSACILSHMKDKKFAIALAVTIGFFAVLFAALFSR